MTYHHAPTQQSHPIETAADSLSGRAATEILTEIVEVIGSAQKFVLAAHIGPDGDSLGSCAALALGLRALGKNARAIVADEIPARYSALFAGGAIEKTSAEALSAEADGTDWYITLDTSEPERLGPFQPVFFASTAKRICLDHHRTHDSGRHHHELVVPEAPATGCLVLALLDRLGVELTPEIVQALWIAIATDTGWFRFSNTGPWALLDAARLAQGGLDAESLYDRLYHDLTVERAQLIGQVLRNAQPELDGDFVWSRVLLADRGAIADSQMDGVIDYMKAIQGARVFALIVEVKPGSYKISLRGREGAEVESTAAAFGGGGHAKAAGCRFTGPLTTLVDRLKSELRKHLAN